MSQTENYSKGSDLQTLLKLSLIELCEVVYRKAAEPEGMT